MYLIIKGRSESFRSVSLDGEKSSWLIGRDPNCDIVLKASQISRRHAMISLEDGEFFIEDCNSSLGVFVNESIKAQMVSLHNKSQVQKYVFVQLTA